MARYVKQHTARHGGRYTPPAAKARVHSGPRFSSLRKVAVVAGGGVIGAGTLLGATGIGAQAASAAPSSGMTIGGVPVNPVFNPFFSVIDSVAPGFAAELQQAIAQPTDVAICESTGGYGGVLQDGANNVCGAIDDQAQAGALNELGDGSTVANNGALAGLGYDLGGPFFTSGASAGSENGSYGASTVSSNLAEEIVGLAVSAYDNGAGTLDLEGNQASALLGEARSVDHNGAGSITALSNTATGAYGSYAETVFGNHAGSIQANGNSATATLPSSFVSDLFSAVNSNPEFLYCIIFGECSHNSAKSVADNGAYQIIANNNVASAVGFYNSALVGYGNGAEYLTMNGNSATATTNLLFPGGIGPAVGGYCGGEYATTASSSKDNHGQTVNLIDNAASATDTAFDGPYGDCASATVAENNGGYGSDVNILGNSATTSDGLASAANDNGIDKELIFLTRTNGVSVQQPTLTVSNNSATANGFGSEAKVANDNNGGVSLTVSGNSAKSNGNDTYSAVGSWNSSYLGGAVTVSNNTATANADPSSEAEARAGEGNHSLGNLTVSNNTATATATNDSSAEANAGSYNFVGQGSVSGSNATSTADNGSEADANAYGSGDTATATASDGGYASASTSIDNNQVLAIGIDGGSASVSDGSASTDPNGGFALAINTATGQVSKEGITVGGNS